MQQPLYRLLLVLLRFRGQEAGLVFLEQCLTCKTRDDHMQENEAERIKFPQIFVMNKVNL